MKKRPSYKSKTRSRSSTNWNGLKSLTSLLNRAKGVIVETENTTFIQEDIAAFQIANKYKI